MITINREPLRLETGLGIFSPQRLLDCFPTDNRSPARMAAVLTKCRPDSNERDCLYPYGKTYRQIE